MTHFIYNHSTRDRECTTIMKTENDRGIRWTLQTVANYSCEIDVSRWIMPIRRMSKSLQSSLQDKCVADSLPLPRPNPARKFHFCRDSTSRVPAPVDNVENRKGVLFFVKFLVTLARFELDTIPGRSIRGRRYRLVKASVFYRAGSVLSWLVTGTCVGEFMGP